MEDDKERGGTRNEEERGERGTQCVTGCILWQGGGAVARVFVHAEACSVFPVQKQKWTDFFKTLTKMEAFGKKWSKN